MNQHKQLLSQVLKYFRLAVKNDLLVFELSHSTETQENSWLSVYYKENLSFTPSTDGSKWSLLCAQEIAKDDVISLVNRITLMLSDSLRSARQDVNGLISSK